MKGHKERRTGKIGGAFSRMHRALDGWMLARAPASPAHGLHHQTSVFSIFLISVRERMFKIRARSSRDGQVESELLRTAGGIGPDGTLGISSPSTVATTRIFRCKGVDHGEVIRCRRRGAGARGGTGLYGKVESELLPIAGGIGPDDTVGISSPSTVATTGIFRCKGVDHGEVIRCRRRGAGARGGTGLYMTAMKLLRKASVARVNRRLRRYYLIVRLLPNVFALACLSLGSI